jgi:hypothetical protein
MGFFVFYRTVCDRWAFKEAVYDLGDFSLVVCVLLLAALRCFVFFFNYKMIFFNYEILISIAVLL